MFDSLRRGAGSQSLRKTVVLAWSIIMQHAYGVAPCALAFYGFLFKGRTLTAKLKAWHVVSLPSKRTCSALDDLSFGLLQGLFHLAAVSNHTTEQIGLGARRLRMFGVRDSRQICSRVRSTERLISIRFNSYGGGSFHLILASVTSFRRKINSRLMARNRLRHSGFTGASVSLVGCWQSRFSISQPHATKGCSTRHYLG